MKTIRLLVAAVAAALALPVGLAAAAVAGIPVSVQSVLLDADHNVLTVDPPTVDLNGNPVQNGDFLIFRIPTAEDIPVGNGIDDRTRGIFDFRSDQNYASFVDALTSPGAILTNARLQLVLTPRDSLFINDQISLENGPFRGDPAIGNQILDAANPFLSNGVSKIVTLDLKQYYTNEQLFNFLSNGSGQFMDDGRIILQYGDDAIVSGAALLLTAFPVPEPGTALLAAIGLAALTAGRRFRQARD
jgi:hypothetical protein